jgi:hypothetical protein
MQCFKYIVNDPPRPLNEEDIWFQIGHVYEQQKDVCRSLLKMDFLTNYFHSLNPLNQLIAESWRGIQSMPKSFNSSAGCITNRAIAMQARIKLLNTLSSRSAQVSLYHTNIFDLQQLSVYQTTKMPRVGTSSGGAIWHSKSSPKPTKPTSRQCIVTAVIPHFGAPLGCSTTKLTSIVMLSTLILVQSD